MVVTRSASLLALALSLSPPVSGAQPQPDIRFSHWTETEQIVASGPGGLVSLSRQQAIAVIEYPGRPAAYRRPVDLLYHQESGALWFGEEYQKYFVFDQRIVGLSVQEQKLRVRNSKHNVSKLTENVMDDVVRQFKNSFRPVGFDRDVLISLEMLFGKKHLYGQKLISVIPSDFLYISKVEVNGRNIKCLFESRLSEKSLSAVFDASFRVVTLQVDDKSLPVLARGFVYPSGQNLVDGWSDPTWRTLPSSQGQIEVAYRSKGEKLAMVYVPSKRLFWVGPLTADRAVMGNRVVGAMVSGKGILLYSSQKRVPKGASVIRTLASALHEIEVMKDSLISMADVRVNLRSILGPGRIVPGQTEVDSGTRLTVDEGELSMRVSTSNPTGRLDISLDDDFAPLSAHYNGDKVTASVTKVNGQ